MPREDGFAWSSPLLEAHQVSDQLLHVGVAVHFAELTVEKPISVSFGPGRSEDKKELKRCGFKTREKQTFKTAPSRKEAPKQRLARICANLTKFHTHTKKGQIL